MKALLINNQLHSRLTRTQNPIKNQTKGQNTSLNTVKANCNKPKGNKTSPGQTTSQDRTNNKQSTKYTQSIYRTSTSDVVGSIYPQVLHYR
jgi:hypothetical protein